MILQKPTNDSEEQVQDSEAIEEAPIESFSMKNAFFVVLGLHILIIGGIVISSHTLKAKEIFAKSDKEYITSNESVYVGVDPTPTPEPTPSPTPNNVAIKTLEKPPIPNNNYPTPSYTKTYVVKKGDTIYSISKKYKLNTQKLIELNNIKNPNNIQIGQTLKFM